MFESVTRVLPAAGQKGRRRVEFFPDYCGWEVRDPICFVYCIIIRSLCCYCKSTFVVDRSMSVDGLGCVVPNMLLLLPPLLLLLLLRCSDEFVVGWTSIESFFRAAQHAAAAAAAAAVP
jgi:hypothetical protein